MNNIYKQICELGQKRDPNILKNFLVQQDHNSILNAVRENINNSSFLEVWNYVLKVFADNTEFGKLRVRLTLAILRDTEEKDVPVTRVKAIISRLIFDIRKFSSDDLARLCKFCLECIQSKKVLKMGWKDLLPELLNVMVEREEFEFEDLSYTGPEYKTDFISSLCMSSWSPSIATALASIFIDMPLTKEELLKITNTLGTYIEKLMPQEIPSLVYQFLRLHNQDSARSMFVKLQNYFDARIYSNSSHRDSSSTNSMDIIELADNQETIHAEGTVLYHVHAAALVSHSCIVDYLNSLKNMTKAPEFVLHPFQLMLLFTISTVSHYEEIVFDIIRPCIVRCYQEEQKMDRSAWYREVVTTTGKPEEIFDKVIQYSLEDRDLVLQALVDFGFTLLGVGSALGRDIIAEKQWSLGNIILLKIIKRKQHTAMTIIQMLCNNIIIRQNSFQYIECLYILSKSLRLLLLENQSCIVELMNSLMQIPGSSANQLLDALVPITRVSLTLRDHLIILLRKALYSSSIEIRKTAVSGFLKLTAYLNISNAANLSQNSFSSFSSGHSIFTQLSMSKSSQAIGPNPFSNEALCLEVLGILKRCFMQQMEVRAHFYKGLCDTVSTNYELSIPAVQLLWFHLKDFYVVDEQQLPPLDFKKISVLRDTECVQLEPLGELVNCISLIVNEIMQHDDKKENVSVLQVIEVMESLCNRMKNCELVHFELDDGTDLMDVLPESQQKLQILKEAMSMYEALIGYKILMWNPRFENQAKDIYALFQGYCRLEQFAKSLSKPKKAESKKKKDSNKSTQQTQANSTTNFKKDGQKISRTFKNPDTILDFQCVRKALSLLHEPKLTWVTVTEANVLKTKKEFHQNIMQSTLHLVQKVKRHKVVDGMMKKKYYDHITDVAVILFNRIVKRLEEFLDFDGVTAVLAMDCFYYILSLVHSNYKSNLKLFLNKLVPDEKDKGVICQLTVIFEVYQKIFQVDESELSDDAEIRKISLTAINTIGILANLAPNDGNVLTVKIFDWLKHFAYNNTASAKVASAFINLFFELHLRYKPSLTVLEQMSINIGEIVGVITEESNENPESFNVINESSVNNVFLSLSNTVKGILDDVDAVIARLKSECNIISLPGIDNVENKKERLKLKERGVCCHLCFVITIMTSLSNLVIQPGTMTEAVFKNIIALYNTLSTLTKYFATRSSKNNLAFQGARYERLVKLAGKQLAPAVYKFILHLEESQTENNRNETNKKKSSDALKSKVLRETRLIPKAVYEIEQFSRCVIQLSNKTKVDLSKYVGQGTVRDFRIVQLKEVLENAEEQPSETTMSTQADDSGVRDSEEEQPVANGDGDDEENDKENGCTPPPAKRSRKLYTSC